MSTLTELQGLARQHGLRGFKKYSKKELCKKLGVEYPGDGRKTITVILKNVSSGDTLRFRSVYEVSRVLHMNPGSISYAIRTKKQIVTKECGLIPVGEYILYGERQE